MLDYHTLDKNFTKKLNEFNKKKLIQWIESDNLEIAKELLGRGTIFNFQETSNRKEKILIVTNEVLKDENNKSNNE